jgi:hypothetical protein
MGKRKRKRGGRPSPDLEAARARLWSAPALFAVWFAFVLAKTYSDAWGVLRQGLSFFLLTPWSGRERVVPAGTLALDALLDLSIVVIVAVAAYGIGMPVVRRLFRAPAGRLERALLAEGLGLGLFALALLALGVFGLDPDTSVYSLAGAGIGLNAYELIVRLRGGPPKSSPEAPPLIATIEPFEWACLAATAYAAALHLVGALAPETFYDSLVYHLAVPNQIVQNGGIAPTPQILHANFPQNVEMLYLAGLVLRGEIAAKLLHLWLGALACLALYELARTACSRRTALLAVALFSTVPVVGASAWHTGVELGVTFWSLMGAWALVRGLFALSNPDQRRELSPRWLVLSGAFFGFAAGAKYTAVWGAAAAAAGLAWGLSRDGKLERPLALRLVAIWSIAALSAFAPWLIKNALFTGNPVYPFFGGWFLTPGLGVDVEGFAASARGHFWHGGALSWKTWLLQPWELFTRGRSSFSFIGPLFAALAPLALLWRRAAFPFGFLLALFAVQYALWASTTSMVRLLIPGLPLFCLYAAHSLTRLGREWRPWAPWLAMPLVAWNLAWNAAMLNEMKAPGPVFGYETRLDYLSKPQHGYHYPIADAADWISRLTPADSKVLIAGDSRSYPIGRRAEAASIFDPDPLLARLAVSDSPESLFLGLREEGFTHLLVGHGEAYRHRGPELKALSAKRIETLTWFLRGYANPLYRNAHGAAVYELRAPDGPVVAPATIDDLPELVKVALSHGASL